MAYKTMNNFLDEFGIDAYQTILQMKAKGATDAEVAIALPKSRRTKRKLTRRRVSQIIEECVRFIPVPPESCKSCLEHRMQAVAGEAEWEIKSINNILERSEEATRESLRWISGGLASAADLKEDRV